MKATKAFSLFILGLATLGANLAAADQTKKARSNDLASEYILKDNGDLFRIIKSNGNKCQITNRVQDFKVSQHPRDAAMIYFIKNGDLYVLNNNWQSRKPCPEAITKSIMSGVKKIDGKYKYTVVSNTDTEIVNLALDDSFSRQFVAWDNKKVVFKSGNVVDYQNHGKYGVRGAPFSSYVAFALTRDRCIIKVKGKDPENSKADCSRYFDSIREFKEVNGIK